MKLMTETLINGKRLCGNELLVDVDCSMNLSKYKVDILDHLEDISSVVLAGTDPALYPDLARLIRFNNACKIRTLIITPGKNLQLLENIEVSDLKNVEVRVTSKQ